MKRIITASLTFILSLILLCACVGPGASDWTYDELPGDYEIWRINSCSIVIGKSHGTSLDNALDDYIKAFCYNDDFIVVKALKVDGSLSIDEQEDIISKAENAQYYIIDVQTGRVSEPYDIWELSEVSAKLKVGKLCEWIETDTLG